MGTRSAAVVFALALLVRGAYLAESRAGLTFDTPVVDARAYHELALGLAAGHGMTAELFWQPLFYPLFLAAVYWLGGTMFVARVLQMALGAATAALAAVLGARTFGRTAGWIAGTIVAVYGPLVFLDGELVGAGWATFWSVALLLLVMRIERGAGWASCLGTGVVAGLAALTRPDFLIFEIAVWGWLALRRGARGGRAAQALLLAVGFALVAAPASWLAWRHSGRASFLPASGGLNLYIGNNPDAAHTVAIRPGAEWEELTRLPARRGVMRRQDTSRFFAGQVLEYAREKPSAFLKGLAAKAMQFISSRELPRNVDVYVFRPWSRVLTLLVWKAGSFGFPFGVLLVLTVTGLVLCRREVPHPLLLLLLLYPAAVVLVFVSGRYRVPVVPAMAVVASGGLVALGRLVRERQWRRLSPVAAVATAVTALSVLPGPFPQERADYQAELLYLVGSSAVDRSDLERARPLLERAVALDPGNCDALNSLGIVQARAGALDLAQAQLSQAVACNPHSLTARANLARVLASRGDNLGAERELELALAQDPDRAEVHYHYGVVLSRVGRLEEAARHLRQALAGAHASGDTDLSAQAERRLREIGHEP